MSTVEMVDAVCQSASQTVSNAPDWWCWTLRSNLGASFWFVSSIVQSNVSIWIHTLIMTSTTCAPQLRELYAKHVRKQHKIKNKSTTVIAINNKRHSLNDLTRNDLTHEYILRNYSAYAEINRIYRYGLWMNMSINMNLRYASKYVLIDSKRKNFMEISIGTSNEFIFEISDVSASNFALKFIYKCHNFHLIY